MKHVIVTGATGMVGMALIKECVIQGVRVTALVRKGSVHEKRLPESPLITVVYAGLDELDTVILPPEEYDVFYHLAWSFTNKEDRNAPDKQARNIEYSINAVDLAHRCGCKKFIGAGSQAEYGAHTNDKTSPYDREQPTTAYGISKLAAGKLCAQAARARDMAFAWVRIFSLFGEYELDGTMIRTTLPKLIRGEECRFTSGKQRWDYLYSDDAGRAFFSLGEKPSGDKVYCLGSGEAKTIREYIECMKAVTESDSVLRFGIIEDGNTGNGMCADIDSLVRDTGWMPEISFETGIRKMMRQYEKGIHINTDLQ